MRRHHGRLLSAYRDFVQQARIGLHETPDRTVPIRRQRAPDKSFLVDDLRIEQFRIPRDRLVGRSRPGLYSHLLDQLYEQNVLPPTARRSRLGVLFCPREDGTADMHIIINGEDMGPSARGLPAARPLYAVVDVFASTKSVRLVQLEYGCRYPPLG